MLIESPVGRWQEATDQFREDVDLSSPNTQASSQTEERLSPEQLAEIWARRAYALAKEPPAEATGQTVDLLVFWLGQERYGIEVTNVREIYPLEQLTPVPRTPDFVAGVFSARGRILSVIDLRAFFGLPAPAKNGAGQKGMDQSKIIVVTNTDPTSTHTGTGETAQPTGQVKAPPALQRGEKVEIGILADEVADVVTIFEEDIEPPLTGHGDASATHAGARTEYIQGVTADMLVILSLNILLNDERLIVQEEVM